MTEMEENKRLHLTAVWVKRLLAPALIPLYILIMIILNKNSIINQHASMALKIVVVSMGSIFTILAPLALQLLCRLIAPSRPLSRRNSLVIFTLCYIIATIVFDIHISYTIANKVFLPAMIIVTLINIIELKQKVNIALISIAAAIVLFSKLLYFGFTANETWILGGILACGGLFSSLLYLGDVDTKEGCINLGYGVAIALIATSFSNF